MWPFYSSECNQTQFWLSHLIKLQKCKWKCPTGPTEQSLFWRCFFFCFHFLFWTSFPSDASSSVWRRLQKTTPSSWTRRALKVGLCCSQLPSSRCGNWSDCVICGSHRCRCLRTLCRYGLWLADWVNPCHYTHFSRVTFLSYRGDSRLCVV